MRHKHGSCFHYLFYSFLFHQIAENCCLLFTAYHTSMQERKPGENCSPLNVCVTLCQLFSKHEASNENFFLYILFFVRLYWVINDFFRFYFTVFGCSVQIFSSYYCGCCFIDAAAIPVLVYSKLSFLESVNDMMQCRMYVMLLLFLYSLVPAAVQMEMAAHSSSPQ